MAGAAHQETTSTQRFRRPTWRDPRLVTGVLLVLVSVVSVVLLISLLNRTQPYFVAATDLSVGQRITREDLVQVDARLQDAAQHYVPADQPPGADAVVLQRVPGGQLIPHSALGTADQLDRSPVGIALQTPLPMKAAAGSRVDVWVANQQSSGRGYESARKLITGAEIATVETSTSALGSSTGTTVHVLATPSQVQPLVDAVGNNAKVTLVLNPSGAGA